METWREVLGCPECRGELQIVDGIELHCPACALRFAFHERIPQLLRPQDVARLSRFSQHYQQDRRDEGWVPIPSRLALALPASRPSGYPPLYWEVRHQSYKALVRLLAVEGPPPEAGPVADLGAGTGWLSYRLAQAGYRVLALEASLDQAFGLGAAEVYLAQSQGHLLPVQGNLEHPPLQPGTLSMLLFNASLHYAQDLDGTLTRAALALRPDGRLVVLDTPIAGKPRPGSGRGDGCLGRQQLHQTLLRVNLRPRWFRVRRGPRWWIHQVKTWLKGDLPFSFPMIVADKVGGE